MPSMERLYRWDVFRAKSENNEKSNTELELFELLPPADCVTWSQCEVTLSLICLVVTKAILPGFIAQYGLR